MWKKLKYFFYHYKIYKMGNVPLRGVVYAFNTCDFTNQPVVLSSGSYNFNRLQTMFNNKGQTFEKIKSLKIGPHTAIELYNDRFGIGDRKVIINKSSTDGMSISCINSDETILAIKVLPSKSFAFSEVDDLAKSGLEVNVLSNNRENNGEEEEEEINSSIEPFTSGKTSKSNNFNKFMSLVVIIILFFVIKFAIQTN